MQLIHALFLLLFPAEHSVIQTRPLYQCSACHHQTSLTSGTIFEHTKLPLTVWFLAIHLLTQAKTGLSALALMRQIGVSIKSIMAKGGQELIQFARVLLNSI